MTFQSYDNADIFQPPAMHLGVDQTADSIIHRAQQMGSTAPSSGQFDTPLRRLGSSQPVARITPKQQVSVEPYTPKREPATSKHRSRRSKSKSADWNDGYDDGFHRDHHRLQRNPSKEMKNVVVYEELEPEYTPEYRPNKHRQKRRERKQIDPETSLIPEQIYDDVTAQIFVPVEGDRTFVKQPMPASEPKKPQYSDEIMQVLREMLINVKENTRVLKFLTEADVDVGGIGKRTDKVGVHFLISSK